MLAKTTKLPSEKMNTSDNFRAKLVFKLHTNGMGTQRMRVSIKVSEYVPNMQELEEATCNDIWHTCCNKGSLKLNTLPRYEGIPRLSYGIALKDRDEDDGSAPANRKKSE